MKIEPRMPDHDEEPYYLDNYPHNFYQDDSMPREKDFCDYTFPDGNYCGIHKDVHPIYS